eukprot:gene2705-2742_t
MSVGSVGVVVVDDLVVVLDCGGLDLFGLEIGHGWAAGGDGHHLERVGGHAGDLGGDVLAAGGVAGGARHAADEFRQEEAAGGAVEECHEIIPLGPWVRAGARRVSGP